jgi:riboflavin kinase/FMN adenylyltransferase
VELIRGLYNLRARHRGCALTIGNFDGVHRGHQAVFAQLAAIAKDKGVAGAALTFEPQPREFFSGENAPARLTRFREKVEALADTRLERVVVESFTQAFSQLSPEAFIKDVLVDALDVRHVVVGEDFHYGHRARGSFMALQEAGQELGFGVSRCVTFELDGRRVSSSWVRDALANGELAEAQKLLGRPYCIQGRVARGRQMGRTIGFPTANVPLWRLSTPLSGVFAVRVHGLATVALAGVANLGTRPTVKGSHKLLEVHLFDFDEEIYGRHVSVEFVHRIRDEKKFDSLDALKAQIGWDGDAARGLLGA